MRPATWWLQLLDSRNMKLGNRISRIGETKCTHRESMADFCLTWAVTRQNWFRRLYHHHQQKLEWVLNAPLILSSNVIWHAYRAIAETKIFRLGVSLICPIYGQSEEWIAKKLYYRQKKYPTSNIENFKVYIQYILDN